MSETVNRGRIFIHDVWVACSKPIDARGTFTCAFRATRRKLEIKQLAVGSLHFRERKFASARASASVARRLLSTLVVSAQTEEGTMRRTDGRRPRIDLCKAACSCRRRRCLFRRSVHSFVLSLFQSLRQTGQAALARSLASKAAAAVARPWGRNKHFEIA